VTTVTINMLNNVTSVFTLESTERAIAIADAIQSAATAYPGKSTMVKISLPDTNKTAYINATHVQTITITE
jgi:hypothetical protein